MNCFEALGLDKKKLAALVEFAKERSVTLRFRCEETCTFDKEIEREVESSSYATEKTGMYFMLLVVLGKLF